MTTSTNRRPYSGRLHGRVTEVATEGKWAWVTINGEIVRWFGGAGRVKEGQTVDVFAVNGTVSSVTHHEEPAPLDLPAQQELRTCERCKGVYRPGTQGGGRWCDACDEPARAPWNEEAPAKEEPPAPQLRVVTDPAPWYERAHDRLRDLPDAIVVAADLAANSKPLTMNLQDFRFCFSDGEMFAEYRGGRVPTRYRLNHWSFGQACSLIGCPADFMRKIPGDLAAECMNHMARKRARRVAVYRTIAEVQGIPADTIRAFTSERYARLRDRDVLRWVDETGEETGLVAMSDRGFSVEVQGQRVKSPDGGLGARLSLITENSEVGASSVKTTAAIARSGWRIPITVSGARVRHVGDVDAKATKALDAALKAFKEVNAGDLENQLEAAATPEVRELATWYTWLKSRGIGKQLADKILPAAYRDADGDEVVRTSRWALAVTLAKQAQAAPYFDARLQQELKASRVLGL